MESYLFKDFVECLNIAQVDARISTSLISEFEIKKNLEDCQMTNLKEEMQKFNKKINLKFYMFLGLLEYFENFYLGAFISNLLKLHNLFMHFFLLKFLKYPEKTIKLKYFENNFQTFICDEIFQKFNEKLKTDLNSEQFYSKILIVEPKIILNLKMKRNVELNMTIEEFLIFIKENQKNIKKKIITSEEIKNAANILIYRPDFMKKLIIGSVKDEISLNETIRNYLNPLIFLVDYIIEFDYNFDKFKIKETIFKFIKETYW